MSGEWLWAEMEKAAKEYAEIPEHLRPVITVVITVEPTRTDLCSICGEYPSHVEHRHTVEPTPHAQCTPPFHVAECDDYSEDIGYGVRTCGGCGQRVPLYVMRVMCAHYVDGKVCGWSHS